MSPFKARPPFISATHAASARIPGAWRGKGFLRLLFLLVAAALVAAVAANFGIARDYGYLRESILTGAAGGHYHTIAARLAFSHTDRGVDRERQPADQWPGALQ